MLNEKCGLVKLKKLLKMLCFMAKHGTIGTCTY